MRRLAKIEEAVTRSDKRSKELFWRCPIRFSGCTSIIILQSCKGEYDCFLLRPGTWVMQCLGPTMASVKICGDAVPILGVLDITKANCLHIIIADAGADAVLGTDQGCGCGCLKSDWQ